MIRALLTRKNSDCGFSPTATLIQTMGALKSRFDHAVCKRSHAISAPSERNPPSNSHPTAAAPAGEVSTHVAVPGARPPNVLAAAPVSENPAMRTTTRCHLVFAGTEGKSRQCGIAGDENRPIGGPDKPLSKGACIAHKDRRR